MSGKMSDVREAILRLKEVLTGFSFVQGVLPREPFRLRTVKNSKEADGALFGVPGRSFSKIRRKMTEEVGRIASHALRDKYAKEKDVEAEFICDFLDRDLPDNLWNSLSWTSMGLSCEDDIGTLLMWQDIILGGVSVGGDMAALSAVGLSAMQARWVPVVWVGNFPNGYLVIFPLPERSAPVPKDWIVTPAEAKAALPILKKAIDRSTLPLLEYPVAEPSGWRQMVASLPADALRAALNPVVDGGGQVGQEAVEFLASRATSATIAGTAAKPELVLGLTTLQGLAVTMRCAAPWTGALNGLPEVLARILRHYNGMTLEDGLTRPRWYRYISPTSGFDLDWSVWEISDDDTEPAAWKRKPLVPFSNGQDLWAYHPARLLDGTLELVKLDHENNCSEAEPIQHPGVRFLRVVVGVLKAV